MKLFQLSMVVAGLLFTSSLEAQLTKGRIGSPAPSIQNVKWIKGTPFSEFKKGEVYVVEFWATWCGPCRKAMPHLSELARKYRGKATILSLNVFEVREPEVKDESYLPKVEEFVQSMGSQMDYSVAADRRSQNIVKDWLQPFGVTGIPASFIINPDGHIAWVGHPEEGLAEALEAVINGSFDMAAAIAKHEAQETEKKRLGEQRAKINIMDAPNMMVNALNAKDYPKALQIVDDMIAGYPELSDDLSHVRTRCLLKIDPERHIATQRVCSMGLLRITSAI